MWDKSTGSLKCALSCFVSMLKSISFVCKWKHVVNVLSPLSLKSYGGSHIYNLTFINCFICQFRKPSFLGQWPKTHQLSGTLDTLRWLPITRTLPTLNLALTQTKVDFPWISFILNHNFTLDNSNPLRLPLTQSKFCFPHHFFIILPSKPQNMF